MENIIDNQLSVIDSANFIEQVNETSLGKTQNNKDDFQYIKIADVTISNKSLRKCDFNFSSLTNVTFDHINLEGAEFNYTSLNNVTFSNCRLNRSSFDFASFTSVTFQNCILQTSCFDYAKGGIVFNNCNAQGVELQHTLAEVNFHDCNCNYIRIKCCPSLNINATNCDFYDGELLDSTLIGSAENSFFVGTYFTNSNGTNLKFIECTIRDINTENSIGFSLSSNDDDFDDFDFE